VKEGDHVFITGRRQAELDKAVAEIDSNVTAVQGDVSNVDDLDRLYKEVAARKASSMCYLPMRASWSRRQRQP
jgi:NAD(P)-dependent dehydrogenase (short-subunit alcohol dehydrogenase family)